MTLPRLEELDMRNLRLTQTEGEYRSADLVPSMNQKAALRRFNTDAETILRFLKLLLPVYCTNVRFSYDAGAALLAHLPEDVSNTKRLTLEEYDYYCRLREKLGLKVEPEIEAENSPCLFTLPFRFDRELKYGVQFTTRSGRMEITTRNQSDALALLNRGDMVEISMFTFLYLLDQHILLFQTRGRGSTIPRFLSVYASKQLNDEIYGIYYQFIRTMRLMRVDAVNMKKLTFEQVMEATSARVESEAESQ